MLSKDDWDPVQYSAIKANAAISTYSVDRVEENKSVIEQQEFGSHGRCDVNFPAQLPHSECAHEKFPEEFLACDVKLRIDLPWHRQWV